MASVESKIFKCDSFTSTYISGLETLRKGNHLNDVVLNVHGRQFSCHKLVLAANSKYFLTMFTAPLNERNLKEIRIPPEIAPEAMETILDYFYSGVLVLSQSNIEAVFRATDYMRLDMLLEICAEYMQETLNLSNCVQSFVLAETIEYSSSRLEDLKKASSALIVSQVEEISQRENFLNLSREQISKILNYNNKPKMAESLYWVILKWVSHDEEARRQFLHDFLQTLPVEGFSYNFLKSTIKNEKLLRKDFKSVLWVMDYALSRLTTSSLTLSEASSFLFADRHEVQKCFLVKKVYNPTPQAIQDRPNIDRISAISYKKQIYLLCGKETEKSYKLDAPNESWVDCNLDLAFGRDCAGCVVLNDDLFVVGGRDWKNNYVDLSSCMKFNFCSGQKQDLPAMKETQFLPGVTIYANSLYAAGGNYTSPSIQKYDVREGRWSTAGQFTTKFGACCATTVADYLYCCGLSTGKVEQFDFRMNRSQEILCSLPLVSKSKWSWISSVGNELFGASGEQILVYDGLADKWNDFCCATNVTDPIIVPWV